VPQERGKVNMAQQEWLYGIHALESIILREPERLIELFVLKGRDDKSIHDIVSQARSLGTSVQFCQRKTLDDKVDGGQHQGVVAKVKPAKQYNENDLASIVESTKVPFLLILDGVTDPHNLGACLRTADAAGVHAVVVPKDKSAALTPVVRKVACGAADVIPLVQVTNLARTLRDLQDAGVWIVGTAGEAENNIYDCKLSGPMALVMGAEGKGMRRLTREHCDELIKLPMAGSVSSLNVSVATGVCLYEIVRQRS
jgi:23S rRNA (guanosine2251-2'-O)-methyltransferase